MLISPRALTRVIRDFIKIERRGRQRERQKKKKNNRFYKQNNNFARASRSFVHFFLSDFLPVFARLRRENA